MTKQSQPTKISSESTTAAAYASRYGTQTYTSTAPGMVSSKSQHQYQSAGSTDTGFESKYQSRKDESQRSTTKDQELGEGANLARNTSPKESQRYSTTQSFAPRQVGQIVHPPVQTSEVIIEHPPIIKGILERPGMVFTNVHAAQTQSTRVTEGAASIGYTASLLPTTTNVYSSVSERTFQGRPSVMSDNASLNEDILRLTEKNEQLLQMLQRAQGQDKDTIFQLRASLETLHRKIVELENKSRQTAHERDELKYKLESRMDTYNHLRDKISELELENKMLRQKLLKSEGDYSVLAAEKSEYEVQVRQLNSELSSKIFAQDFLASETSNRLKISEEKNRHLEKRILEYEDEISRMSRDFKEYREKSSYAHLQYSSSQSDRTVTKVLHTGSTEPDMSAVTAPLYSQIKEKGLQIEELRHRIDSLESKLRQTEKAYGEMSTQLEAEKIRHASTVSIRDNEKKSSSQRIEELTRKLEEALGGSRDEKDKIGMLTREIDALKHRLRASEDENEILKKELSNLQGEKRQIEGKSYNLEIEVTKLTRLVEAKNADNQQLESELNNKNAKISQLQRQISDQEKQISDLKHTVKTLEGAVQRLERDAEGKTSKDTVKELTDEVEGLQEGIKELEEKAVSREEELLAELDAARELVEELEARIEILTEEAAKADEKLQESLDEQQRLREFCDKLICDNSTLDQALRQLSMDYDALQQQLQDTYGQPVVDHSLNNKVAIQLRRLIDLNHSKDDEINTLSAKLEETVKIAEERLLLVQTTQLDNARLINETAELYNLLDRTGISKKLQESEAIQARN